MQKRPQVPPQKNYRNSNKCIKFNVIDKGVEHFKLKVNTERSNIIIHVENAQNRNMALVLNQWWI